MVAPMTGEPSPSIASQLELSSAASGIDASQGRDAEAKALYQEVVKAALGTPQGTEARFRIDAMVPEGRRTALSDGRMESRCNSRHSASSDRSAIRLRPMNW